MLNIHEETEKIVKMCIEKRTEGTIKSDTDLADEIALRISLMVEKEYEQEKEWIQIDNDTEKMKVKEGWIYRTLSTSGYAMCFVPENAGRC